MAAGSISETASNAPNLTRDLVLTLHFFHTNGQCNVASIPLGLSISDALHGPVGTGEGRPTNALYDDCYQTVALCIMRTNRLGQSRFQCGLGDQLAFAFEAFRVFRVHLVSRILR